MYEWYGMKKDVATYLKYCKYCQKIKDTYIKELFQSIIATKPKEREIYDLTELKQDQNSNRYIFGIVDAFSKKAWTVALPHKNSHSIVKYLRKTFTGNYFHLWQADNGREFTSKEILAFIAEVDGEKIHSIPRHPQTNNYIEQLWGSIKLKLRAVNIFKILLTCS
jgi:transposase InsO family protein